MVQNDSCNGLLFNPFVTKIDRVQPVRFTSALNPHQPNNELEFRSDRKHVSRVNTPKAMDENALLKLSVG